MSSCERGETRCRGKSRGIMRGRRRLLRFTVVCWLEQQDPGWCGDGRAWAVLVVDYADPSMVVSGSSGGGSGERAGAAARERQESGRGSDGLGEGNSERAATAVVKRRCTWGDSRRRARLCSPGVLLIFAWRRSRRPGSQPFQQRRGGQSPSASIRSRGRRSGQRREIEKRVQRMPSRR